MSSTQKFAILDLKPAQIAIGLLEVEHKIKQYAHLSRDAFHEYSEAHPVPVVQSDHGLYIIDHHHLCRAYHELGHSHVHVAIQADFSDDPAGFWARMEVARWVLPQDQFGQRHPYHQLPSDIRGMADDPYRSLVWRLKELGYWTKVAVPFAEFQVANFFRDLVVIGNTKASFELGVAAAIAFLAAAPPERLAQMPGLARVPVQGGPDGPGTPAPCDPATR
jgi:hypothetical protein